MVLEPEMSIRFSALNLKNSLKQRTHLVLAKISIKRKFIRDNTSEILTLLMQLRSGTIKQSGYISSETLTSATDPQSIVVRAAWQGMEDWLKWKGNPT